jgi:hypothetical protein
MLQATPVSTRLQGKKSTKSVIKNTVLKWVGFWEYISADPVVIPG